MGHKGHTPSGAQYTVYKHTVPNGKVYIGITCQEPLARWKRGYGYKHCVVFYRAIQKHGWENIRHDILFTGLTKEKAEAKEIELIDLYDSTNPAKGYNSTNGGHAAGVHTEKTKELLRHQKLGDKSVNFGKPAYNRGIPATPEQRQKVSEARKGKGTGERNCNYGGLSDEHKRKMSIARKGWIFSDEWRANMSTAHIQSENKGRLAVVCIDTGHIYRSAHEAAAERPKATYQKIQACCRGERNTSGGYRWQCERRAGT